MKLSLLVLAATATTALAAPAEPNPDVTAQLAPAAPGDFVVTINDDATAATAEPAVERDEEKRDVDLAEGTHDLAKRWWGEGGWIGCGGQWWEYGKKRVAIQYTGITDNDRMFQYLIQGWRRTDKNIMEINWGFPDSETARQIQLWKDLYGITCHW